jgi:pimeloyl-ACP methyl ester carboxylesterase
MDGTQARQRLLATTSLTERRLDLAGVSTAVLEGGDGPPVILLHGPGEFAAKWMLVSPRLVATHRVIAPDLPGHGASVVDGPVDTGRVLAWLGELIDHTCPPGVSGGRPPVVVGHGFALATRFAVDHSDLLDHLVLVDTLGLAPFEPAAEFAAALEAFAVGPDEETYDDLWHECVYDLSQLRADLGTRWETFKAYYLDRARAPSVQAALHALMEEGLAEIPAADLERITVPTTLVWGRHDLATPLRIAQAASARYGWGLQVIENASDDPALEQPEAFHKALLSALSASALPEAHV